MKMTEACLDTGTFFFILLLSSSAWSPVCCILIHWFYWLWLWLLIRHWFYLLVGLYWYLSSVFLLRCEK